MDKKNLKERLKAGDILFGPFIRMSEPSVTEIIGYAGYDFAIIDLEHGPMSVRDAENLVRAANQAGISPIIRVRESAETMILRALDTGAAGVQIPQINSVEAARASVSSSKFYPEGHRGVCKYTRNAEYSNIKTPKYFEKANEDTLTILQIEGKEGIEKIDEILDVPGIDVLFLGPYDLSQALGITGQVDDPKVIDVIEKITKKCIEKGIAVGCFAINTEAAKKFIQMGIQYMAYSIDTGMLYESFLSERIKLDSLR